MSTITPRADMCFALASYLTRERGNHIPRHHIERLLWPGMRSRDAAHSLSELINKLGRRGIHIQRDGTASIWLPRESTAIDIDFLRSDPPPVMAGRDLSILPGYTPRVSSAFRDWLDEWRGHMGLQLLDEIVTAMARASLARDWSVMLALANHALRIDPHNQRALTSRAHAADHLARASRLMASTDILPVVPANILAGDTGASRLHEGTVVPSIWQPTRPATSASTDTALVGRAEAMQRLTTHAGLTLAGKVNAAFISGVTGVGKSRLVRELTGWIIANGGVACTVSCSRPDGHRPLSTFIQAVPRLQALPGAAGCEPATVACLSRITILNADEPDIAARDDSENLSASVRASVVDLVDAVADEQPLLFVVEDVHWIDSASRSLLRSLVATAQRAVFVVCTSRMRWQHQSWGDPDGFAMEDLQPLDTVSARAHVVNCLIRAERNADDRFIDWCVEMSAGNPYFIEELINYWIATGKQYSAPPSLVALVEARLACVRPSAMRVIQAAAILGKNSTVDLLQRVLEFPTHVLLSSIEELGEAGMLTLSQSPAGTRSAPALCRHDLVTRAATRSLSPQGRALLHHAAARAIESVASGRRSAELLWDCADHWHAAGQAERSTSAAVECARHLHDMGLVHDAIKRCNSALAKCPSHTAHPIVLRTLAQLYYTARDWKLFRETVKQVHELERASAITRPIHDDLELCELTAQRSLHRDWARALDHALRCVRAPDADARHRVKAAIEALKLATNIGDLALMDTVFTDMNSVCNQPAVPQRDRLILQMIYHTIRGNAQTSVTIARELLELTERTLPLRYQLPTMLNCTAALRRAGTPGESERICDSIFQNAVPLNCIDFAIEACLRQIEMYVDLARIDDAKRWVANYRALRLPTSDIRTRRTLRIAIARVHVCGHDWSSAARLLGKRSSDRLWEDPVAMLRSAALATKLRLEIGLGTPTDQVSDLVAQLADSNSAFRTIGAQDYECYSLYLGYRYIGKIQFASQFLETYVNRERRDTIPPSQEIKMELENVTLRLRCEA